jgi:hypothetical protein
MFFFYRFLGSSAHPALRWGILALLTGLGVALIVWGLVDRNTIIVVRGVIELVIVAVIVFRVLRFSGVRGQNNPTPPR